MLQQVYHHAMNKGRDNQDMAMARGRQIIRGQQMAHRHAMKVQKSGELAITPMLIREMMAEEDEKKAKKLFNRIMKVVSLPSRNQFSRWQAIKVKARAQNKCEHCGANRNLQAHDPTRQHIDWEDGICLCGSCHSREHPEMARGLFVNDYASYWENISLAAIGKKTGRTTAAVARAARRSGLRQGRVLSEDDLALLVAELRRAKER